MTSLLLGFLISSTSLQLPAAAADSILFFSNCPHVVYIYIESLNMIINDKIMIENRPGGSVDRVCDEAVLDGRIKGGRNPLTDSAI